MSTNWSDPPDYYAELNRLQTALYALGVKLDRIIELLKQTLAVKDLPSGR